MFHEILAAATFDAAYVVELHAEMGRDMSSSVRYIVIGMVDAAAVPLPEKLLVTSTSVRRRAPFLTAARNGFVAEFAASGDDFPPTLVSIYD
jgi:hypothetical protein